VWPEDNPALNWGEGMIDADPLFVDGGGRPMCLSQRHSGQAEDSPCVNAGAGPAMNTCFPTIAGDGTCLDELSTRTDGADDAGQADIGFHYRRRDARLGVRLEMPATSYAPGDPCYLKAYLYNNGGVQSAVPLCVVLEISGQYWFWPHWTQALDYKEVELRAGLSALWIISDFTWPDTGTETMQGITFWSALLTPDLSAVIGGADGIGQWTFSYGPAQSGQRSSSRAGRRH
jgi:hypothetical protein